MHPKTTLKAREIERIENTSIAAALGVGAGPAPRDCTGICVGVLCDTAVCDPFPPTFWCG